MKTIDLNNLKCPDCSETGNFYMNYAKGKDECNSEKCWKLREEKTVQNNE